MNTSYRLVIEPHTFKLVVSEIKYPPLTKRIVDPSELKTWTEQQFRHALLQNGYQDSTCTEYIIQEKVTFTSEIANERS